ncbi:MAG TPA: hypothetical protein VFR47_21280 [Anaerolineales bacterium]|nr:hypothetical protein [Anaerolineales bacterium]
MLIHDPGAATEKFWTLIQRGQRQNGMTGQQVKLTDLTSGKFRNVWAEKFA